MGAKSDKSIYYQIFAKRYPYQIFGIVSMDKSMGMSQGKEPEFDLQCILGPDLRTCNLVNWVAHSYRVSMSERASVYKKNTTTALLTLL